MNHSQRSNLLRRALESHQPVWTVHYACAGWQHADAGPLAVSAICFHEILTRSELTFSVTDRKEEAERYVLESFYQFIANRKDAHFLHWNMNRSEFGFVALGNRYRVLVGSDPPIAVAEGQQHDLDDLVGLAHGRDFAAHPKLHSLGLLNGFVFREWRTGPEQAAAFDAGRHADLKRSCAEKVRLIAYLADRFLTGRLITNHGGPRVEFAGEMLDAVAVVTGIGDRARVVSRQLKRRHGKRPTLEINDEYDWQDLFHALLRLFFDDVRAEDHTPIAGGASARVDFVLPAHRLAVELKHARDGMTSKTLGEELIIDRDRYAAHPAVSHLVTLVLDPDGVIANPRGIEADLSKGAANSGLSSTVRIYDR